MKFAVVGDPVAQSLSPQIHNAGYAEIGFDAEYVHLRIADDEFRNLIVMLREGELDGVNVTMPHKERAYEGVDGRSDLAYRTGAVNTITRSGGQLVGDNTDVAGVMYAKERTGVSDGAPVLILGAGGAAGAAAVALEEHPVAVSARSERAARDLLQRCDVDGEVVPWGEPMQGALVVNATPIGMHGEELPEGIIERAGALIDMAYGGEPTPAVRTAVNLGLPYADGIDMLVGQAQHAFEIFTDRNVSVLVLDGAARGY